MIRIAIFLLVTVAFAAEAQERKILGRIMSRETNKPIKNAHVLISHTTSGTFTNAMGYFELTIKPSVDWVLIISHVGYKTSELPIPAQNQFLFYLEREEVTLNDLYLSAYPIAKATLAFQDTASPPEPGFTVVESGAKWPGGMSGFYDYLGNALTSKPTGRPVSAFSCRFTIDESGKVAVVSLSEPIAAELAAEVRQIFTDMPPWLPATQRNEKVPQHFQLFVTNDSWPAPNPAEVYKIVSDRIRYPALARRNAVEGSVISRFTVNQGIVTRFEVLNEIGAGCGEEVRARFLEVPAEKMKLLGPPVATYVIAVNFGLDDDFKTKDPQPGPSEKLLPTIFVTARANRQDLRSTGSTDGVQMVVYGLDPGVQSLEQALANPKKTERLTLTGQGLEAIPPELTQLKNLKAMNLENNRIREFPEGLTGLSKLQELYLYDNLLERLPDGFSQLSSLVVLRLAKNKFTEFPKVISKLKNLQSLDLNENQLSKLPLEVAYLYKLKVLSLKNNMLNELPFGLFSLTRLEKLDLTGNPLTPEQLMSIRKSLPNTIVTF